MKADFHHPIDFKLRISPVGKFANGVKGFLSVDSGSIFNVSKQCNICRMLDQSAALTHMKMVPMEHIERSRRYGWIKLA
ncbi:hypothetical protein [Thalassospira indica]|uniref:MOSC domain-containing protein n=1 Tax=Thalassospira indica TaxID=1891279 RepID=A0ABM6XWA7_9PROT|nr:hypothetical protein [Thalassospira indica]AXO13940.1 hypothetical protein DY252_06645 [Thalassospira indica]OAZ13032.1 hypothetical protein TH15_13990 [Thalassospira profundimaris]